MGNVRRNACKKLAKYLWYRKPIRVAYSLLCNSYKQNYFCDLLLFLFNKHLCVNSHLEGYNPLQYTAPKYFGAIEPILEICLLHSCLVLHLIV